MSISRIFFEENSKVNLESKNIPNMDLKMRASAAMKSIPVTPRVLTAPRYVTAIVHLEKDSSILVQYNDGEIVKRYCKSYDAYKRLLRRVER